MVLNLVPHHVSSLLVVDDQPFNIHTLYQIFSGTHQVRVATTGSQALEACEEQLPDLILLDVMMPDMDGHEVCRRLKADERTKEIPIIFVTAQNDPHDEALGLELGAVDFITKPVNAAVVRARVNTHLQLRQALDQVRTLASHDALTGLPNRRLLGDRFTQAIAASRRSGHYGALIFLDLDNFKPLNDVHGHEVGDQLLLDAAKRLLTCVRETDTVARFGGDEFVVLINGLTADLNESTNRARAIAEKIRISLAEPYYLTLNKEGKQPASVEHQCTGSIGVALFLGQHNSPVEVLKWADLAMYEAKEAGRNRIRFYAPPK
ncbi:diguanylate cyclase domain-containing protein [Undibacterium sp.]|uniref:diguanylate cyclase domain-containing protein n=1 Tax=Undibacterium sp. TaxID=1914977 RepID=UPI003752CE93